MVKAAYEKFAADIFRKKDSLERSTEALLCDSDRRHKENFSAFPLQSQYLFFPSNGNYAYFRLYKIYHSQKRTNYKIRKSVTQRGPNRVAIFLAEVSNGLVDSVVPDEEETRQTHFSNSHRSRLRSILKTGHCLSWSTYPAHYTSTRPDIFIQPPLIGRRTW